MRDRHSIPATELQITEEMERGQKTEGKNREWGKESDSKRMTYISIILQLRTIKCDRNINMKSETNCCLASWVQWHKSRRVKSSLAITNSEGWDTLSTHRVYSTVSAWQVQMHQAVRLCQEQVQILQWGRVLRLLIAVCMCVLCTCHSLYVWVISASVCWSSQRQQNPKKRCEKLPNGPNDEDKAL